MLRNQKWILICFVLLGVLPFSKTAAAVEGEDRNTTMGGGGHDVPTPFEVMNPKYELSDGEIYLLSGQIQLMPARRGESSNIRPFLWLDLAGHAALANSQRVRDPLYPISGSLQRWMEKRGNYVQLLFKAHGRVVQGTNGAEYEIYLEPLSP